MDRVLRGASVLLGATRGPALMAALAVACFLPGYLALGVLGEPGTARPWALALYLPQLAALVWWLGGRG